jgi:hypothetical protein
MAGRCTHAEYYGQLVNDSLIRCVSERIGVDAIKASSDEHFNDIPLGRWDSLAASIPGMVTLPEGEFWSLSTVVCVAKAAARQIKRGKAGASCA